jgi:cell shape-determining protein MreD
VAVLGLLAVALQGALMDLLPPRFVPELGVLAAVAAARVLGRASGLMVAFGVGLAADLLSGALLGQHAALRMGAFLVTVAVGGSLDLQRPVPLAVFVWALALGDAVASLGLTWLFLGPVPLAARDAAPLVVRAAVTAALAPGAVGLAREVVRRLDERQARRDMRLDTRRPGF